MAEKASIPKKIIRTGKRRFNVTLDRKALSKRKKKYRLWKRYMQTKDGKIYEEYCRCRNQLRRMTRQAAKTKERDVAKRAKTNSKLFWGFISSKTKLRPAIPDLYNSNKCLPHEMARNDSEKADILGKFFSSVYTKEPDWSWDFTAEERPSIHTEIEIEFSREAILKQIGSMSDNKSPGPDRIHPRVLKEVANIIVEPLIRIFKISLKIGKIPSAWKTALVTAIYKQKGSKHEPGNYRAISLTSIVCRIMESVIRDSLLVYLKVNKLLSCRQFGFLAGRSTILQLLIILDKWTEILDKGGYVDVIYCDFQKAFDTVPHKRLIDILKLNGLKNPILSWITDFLGSRKQRVAVNGSLSKEFDVRSGVPQGSVLGPLLFIMYINNLVAKATTDDVYLYADDLKLFAEISTDEDVEKLQHNVDNVYDPDKCVSMRLQPSKGRKLPINDYYNMDNVRINSVYSQKDLGIIFDNNLTFEEHIRSKVCKANGLLGMLRRSFTYMDKDMFKQLFTSIVRPHLEYGAPVWNPSSKKLITLIENVQRRGSKMVPGLGHLSYKERLTAMNLPTLQYRRYRGDMIETFKLSDTMYDNGACQELIHFNPRNVRGYNLRGHDLQIGKVSFRKDIRKYSFKCRIANQWNCLPREIVESPSLNTFKSRLDKLWAGVMFDSVINIYDVTSTRVWN